MKKDTNGLYMTAIVACVAVVALVVLVMNGGGESAELSLDVTDIAGQAYGGAKINMEVDAVDINALKNMIKNSGAWDDFWCKLLADCWDFMASPAVDEIVNSQEFTQCTVDASPYFCFQEMFTMLAFEEMQANSFEGMAGFRN